VVFQSRAGFSECLDFSFENVRVVPGGFNPVLGFLSVSTYSMRPRTRRDGCFNPVLGFLSVSTSRSRRYQSSPVQFQSRAGFSECLDRILFDPANSQPSFNPVLGFLSVSTLLDAAKDTERRMFQSRAGFSECLDLIVVEPVALQDRFQSRAGFSECLDSLVSVHSRSRK